MRITTTFLAAFILLTASAAFASDEPAPSTVKTLGQNRPAEPADGVLLASATREARRLVVPSTFRADATRVQPVPPEPNWIGRHPVLFGALVGAGAGALAAMTMENELFCSGGDEDCFFHGGSRAFVGAGFGAGIGAMVGLAVDLSK